MQNANIRRIFTLGAKCDSLFNWTGAQKTHILLLTVSFVLQCLNIHNMYAHFLLPLVIQRRRSGFKTQGVEVYKKHLMPITKNRIMLETSTTWNFCFA